MSLDEYGRGRCINCGFLGQRGKGSDSTECRGVSEEKRLKGEITLYKGSEEALPCCFVGAYDLFGELGGISYPEPGYRGELSEIIAKDRQCEHWYPWTEFRSPAQHYEEFKMKQLEEQRTQSERLMHRLTIIAIVVTAISVGSAFLAAWLFRN
jgi:hypothetical protein